MKNVGFGFIMHPLDSSYLARAYPVARFLPKRVVDAILRPLPPFAVSKFELKRHKGVFVGCPLTEEQMRTLPREEVLDKIARSCAVAKQHGADIVSLGAYTAIATDQGMAIKDRVPVALTSGRAFTVWAVLAQVMPYFHSGRTVAIVGANGAIGSAVARLSADFPILSIGRGDLDRMYDADIIVLCTSDPGYLVDPARLRSGTVVCDAAKPFNMPRDHGRDDIVVIEGGQIDLPHPVEFGIDFDCGPNRVYACMAEPMVLALSGRVENFCLGNDIPMEKVMEIGELSKQHGFRPVMPEENPKLVQPAGIRLGGVAADWW